MYALNVDALPFRDRWITELLEIVEELFPKAVDGPGDSSGFSFSVDVLDAVDYLL
jgi:hypothetical protein